MKNKINAIDFLLKTFPNNMFRNLTHKYLQNITLEFIEKHIDKDWSFVNLSFRIY